ncbi:MAG TPA: cation diffusion facilitator family transporter [Clostridia bacterium]|nr:cation diffusion facilitator family transporter [Clostridia bacterium]
MASKKERKYYLSLSAWIGIGCNVVLSAFKCAVGFIFGAISVIADGLNNLSDIGGNIVSLVAFKVASRPADREHPYGHARAEYIAAMAVAFIVFIFAVELIKSAIEKIITPVATEFSIITIAVLAFSICVKLFMFAFNRILAKKINSVALKATATDSISDVIATSAVLAALIISYFTGIDLDAYMTILVALFIVFAGLKILKETMTKLLGEGPTKELANDIRCKILAYEGVLGVHDLEVHNYGPEQVFASAHVEVDARRPILESHDMIDLIEQDLCNIHLVIHLDPIVVDDPIVNETREKAIEIVKNIDECFEIHDFRMVIGKTHTNVIFDVVAPFECKINDKILKEQIIKAFKEWDKTYFAVVKIDRN